MTGTTRLRIGMVGGGPGADIGRTHRFALRLDDRYELQAGVFGQDRGASSALGSRLHVPIDRVYPDYASMAEAEAARADGIEVVAVVTPNDSHHRIARAFIEQGISVICEKPLASTLDDALDLQRLALKHHVLFAVPHSYSAYAMVRQAARMVRDNELGRVTPVQVEHASGWAATALEKEHHKQAMWRTDPAVAGYPSVVADLGTHAYHLLRYVTDLEVSEVSADLSSIVPDRRVFDNAFVGLRLATGARGTLWASMAATGNEHGLRLRVFGDRASLEWRHEDPHHLIVRDLNGTTTIVAQGSDTLSDDAQRLTRVGLGHPEGFLEAFANFYSDVADALQARRAGTGFTPRDLSFPTVDDGVIGVRFIEAVLASHESNGQWMPTGAPAPVGSRA